ncbi:MAG: hypothetical protein PHV30_02905 [Candidatus Margulisbacteria bacterium]|nr:hypothetical protein [Candidatus Margulisiibacteriota bacterium]
MFKRFLLIILLFSLFFVSVLHTPKKKIDSPFFQELWVAGYIPTMEQSYYECLNMPDVNSQHMVVFGLKAPTADTSVTLNFDIINLSTGKVLFTSPKNKIQLVKNKPLNSGFRLNMPSSLDHGFYYVRMYINDEFINYKNYNQCAGNMIVYK